MLSRLGVAIPLAQAKIDQVNLRWFRGADDEIVRLHVPMEEVLPVHVLETGDHLVANHQHSFE